MIRIALSVIFQCFILSTYCQTPIDSLPPADFILPMKEMIYLPGEVDTPPAFRGGEQELMAYFSNIPYPKEARKKKLEGLVVVKFVIDLNGKVSDAQIMKDIGGGCGAIVLDYVNNLPDWEPGVFQGKRVKVEYTLPIRFHR